MCHFRFISLGVNPLPESFQAIRWKIYAEEKTKRIKTNNIYRREVVNRVLRKEQGYKMLRFRNYWIYSAGLAIAWAVVLLLTLVIRGTQSAQTLLLVFLGFCICWVSATIARYVYPPPKRWELNRRQE